MFSAYHELTGEAMGKETVPTHYWRDRRKDGRALGQSGCRGRAPRRWGGYRWKEEIERLLTPKFHYIGAPENGNP